jgi:hypothetical protein
VQRLGTLQQIEFYSILESQRTSTGQLLGVFPWVKCHTIYPTNVYRPKRAKNMFVPMLFPRRLV